MRVVTICGSLQASSSNEALLRAATARAPEGMTYTDSSRGDFEWRNGKFRTQVKLYKNEPGIYTIVCMVRRVPSDKGFPGGEVCIVSK